MEALRAELGGTDLLLEGFRPGVLERLGLAPATLLESFPRLVIGRLSGWGTRGPLAMRAGHDINYLALSGALAAIGTSGEPAIPLNLIADFGGGAMHLLTGVLAKLVQRSITGRGGVVHTSILAGTIGLTSMFYGLLGGGLWQLQRCANLLDGGAPFYRIYRCRDDRFIAVGCIEPKFYRQLLDVTGLGQEIDPQTQYSERTWADTAGEFAACFLTRTCDEWVEAAADRDACLSSVLNFAEAAGDAHNRANDFFCQDPWARPGNMIRFSES